MTTAWKAGSSRICRKMSALSSMRPDDALHEGVGEDEAEVLDGVGAGLGDELLVAEPGRLHLVEEELVGGAELEPEPLVEDLDDGREVLLLLLGLLALARVDRRQLADSVVRA